MTTQTITHEIRGIKCDNPACGWKDMNAAFDPDFWLNKECPQCRSNLFTQADYDTMMRMFWIADKINKVLAPVRWVMRLFGKQETTERFKIEMNGTGTTTVTHMPSHKWDEDGEHCINCGDSDWYAGPVCRGRKGTEE